MQKDKRVPRLTLIKTLLGCTVITLLYTLIAGYNSRLYQQKIPMFYILVILIHTIQILGFMPAYLLQTEVFYDATGTLTYIIAILFCIENTKRELFQDKQIITMGLVVLWTIRLGGFLVYRVFKNGGDSRFVRIKRDGLRFFTTWWLQGLWVTFTAGPVFCFLTIKNPAPQGQVARHMSIGPLQVIGLAFYTIGFLTESIADIQKLIFNQDPENKGKFINVGLWKYSRHPNYCGEFFIWVGVVLFIGQSLIGWEVITFISPVFVYMLLTRVSGVPMLEAKAEEKWGGQKEYQEYVQKTPIMFPWMNAGKFVKKEDNKSGSQKQNKDK